MATDFEPVFTVTNFYDQPRAGIANYHGALHEFQCEFDEQQDEYSSVYRLKPIDAEVLSLALEQRDIWRRWEAAFYRGDVRSGTHPALPHERERYEELAAILAPELIVPEGTAIKAVGVFRSDLEVAWEPVG
jgi:hypothetical protein